jgi:ATP-dependent RNA helicase DDX47/RRP3
VAEFGLLFAYGLLSAKMSATSSEASGSRSSSPKHEEPNEEAQGERSGPLFSTLPLIPELQKTVLEVGYKNATEIQTQAIPAALEGRDIIGVAKTGSGKTAAFALPILQKWWEDPKPLYACIIAPTRYVEFYL